MTTKTRIQLRRGNFTDLPTLLAGEAGFALDTATLYVGNGVTNYPIGAVEQKVCQGRLTFLTNTPVTHTNISLATNLYFTPYIGNQISLYTNSKWKMYDFTQITFDLRAVSWSYNYNYDVFIYDASGTLTLVIIQWASDFVRYIALAYQDGILVKSDALNYRYLGTLYGGYRSGYAGIWGYDTVSQRYLYNHYNKVLRHGFSCPNYNDNNAQTTYAVSAGTTMAALLPYIEFVIGEPNGDVIHSSLTYRATVGAAATAHVGIGLDVGSDVRCSAVLATASTIENGNITIPIIAVSGYHSLRFKAGAVTAAATFVADDLRYGAPADNPASFITMTYLN